MATSSSVLAVGMIHDLILDRVGVPGFVRGVGLLSEARAMNLGVRRSAKPVLRLVKYTTRIAASSQL